MARVALAPRMQAWKLIDVDQGGSVKTLEFADALLPGVHSHGLGGHGPAHLWHISYGILVMAY